jgi:TPP-dependent pyruvate/acetoin dehydrogenase alpha subunit
VQQEQWKENRVYTPDSDEEALKIYRKLSLIRQSQNAIIREYPNDEIKTPVHLGIGLEGISVGVAHCIPSNAKSFGQLRNHGQYLAITGETDRFFGELYGKVTGTSSGKGGSMHLSAPEDGLISTSGIVGSTVSLAVGAAFAAKYRGTDDIAVVMFGDGVVEEGEFWESLNFACLHQLRVLFICEDNNLAIHTVGEDRRGFKNKSISTAVEGFDCDVSSGDGTDVLIVAEMVSNAVAKMINNPKPAFLHLTWMRALEHVGPNSDFHIGYRSQPSEDELTDADPVYKYEKYLLAREISPNQLQELRKELDRQIEKSIESARVAPFPTEADLFKGVLN